MRHHATPNRWTTSLGGSFAYAHAKAASATPQKSLRSFNAGATLILNYDWMLGISGTWNGTSGLTGASVGPTSAAYGATASVNYNHGRWTAGAYYQLASSEGDPLVVGNDRLRAAEAAAHAKMWYAPAVSARRRKCSGFFYYSFS